MHWAYILKEIWSRLNMVPQIYHFLVAFPVPQAFVFSILSTWCSLFHNLQIWELKAHHNLYIWIGLFLYNIMGSLIFNYYSEVL